MAGWLCVCIQRPQAGRHWGRADCQDCARWRRLTWAGRKPLPEGTANFPSEEEERPPTLAVNNPTVFLGESAFFSALTCHAICGEIFLSGAGMGVGILTPILIPTWTGHVAITQWQAGN